VAPGPFPGRRRAIPSLRSPVVPPAPAIRAALPAGATRAVLRDLNRARRHRRVGHIDWIDVLYKVYAGGLVSLAVLYLASAAVGDARVGAATVASVRDHGAAWLGLALALAVALALRSGARGGPLALEAPDVAHVLLAPVDRAVVLRSAAYKQLRAVAVGGILAGGVAGNLASRRLSAARPADVAAWIACGAGFGLLAAAAVWGAALVASGRRLRTPVVWAVGAALVAWSAADLAAGTTTSPATMLGALGTWPLGARAVVPVGVAVAIAVPVAGLRWVGGFSVEAAERRTALVGQLRFAATIQDLRAVVVLHRQLAQERSRSRPWRTLRPRGPTGRAAWRRGWHGVLRWPPARVARVLVLGAVAGAAAVGAWRGTLPLVVLSGLALFVAALDAVEPMAQAVDHPGVTVGVPEPPGGILLRDLAVPCVVMAAVGVAGLATGVALDPSPAVLGVGAAMLITVVAAPVAGAALSVVAGAPRPLPDLQLAFPEMATLLTILRQAFPPFLAVAAVAPVVAARVALRHGAPAGTAAAVAVVAVLLVAAMVAAWIASRRAVTA